MSDPLYVLTVCFAIAALAAIAGSFWCAVRARDHETAEARALAAGATPAEALAAGRLARRCEQWKDRVGATALTLTLATVLVPAALGPLVPYL